MKQGSAIGQTGTYFVPFADFHGETPNFLINTGKQAAGAAKMLLEIVKECVHERSPVPV